MGCAAANKHKTLWCCLGMHTKLPPTGLSSRQAASTHELGQLHHSYRLWASRSLGAQAVITTLAKVNTIQTHRHCSSAVRCTLA